MYVFLGWRKTARFLGAAALGLTICLPVSARQVSGTVSAQVDAIAGIGPVLQLFCSDVDFGVWRVPPRNGGGETRVSLAVASAAPGAQTSASLAGNIDTVARATGFEDPEAGTCTVTGSRNPGQRISVSISGNAGIPMSASARTRLPRAAQDALGIGVDLMLAEQGVSIDSTGAGTFRVIGEFRIPQNLIRDNYGGYSSRAAGSTAAATVTVRDEILP